MTSLAVAGIAAPILFTALVVFQAALQPDYSQEGPLHPWAGAVQRLPVAGWFACLIVLATRSLRLARQRQAV